MSRVSQSGLFPISFLPASYSWELIKDGAMKGGYVISIGALNSRGSLGQADVACNNSAISIMKAGIRGGH